MKITALLLLLLTAFVSAGEDKPKKEETKPAEKAQQASTTGAAGMVASLEGRSADGDVQLSPEMRAALAAMINTSSEGLKEVVKPDGTVIVDLEGRFQSAMVVSIDENGKMVSTCYSRVPEHTCSAARHLVPTAKATESEKKP